MLRLLLILFLPVSLSAQLKRFQFSENKMGSPFNIIFYHIDSLQAVQVAHECFLIVDSLNNIFSDYSVTSEVGKLALQNPGVDLPVSDELFQMILQSKQAWKKSGKTFDITIGPLSQLWRKARAEKRIPTDAEIKKAKFEAGFKNLDVNTSSKTISFKRDGMRFDFGGIVKGYVAQKIIDYLKSKNIPYALADAGGDIVMSDAPPGKNGWAIGINLPEQENELWDKKLELNNCSVATSGDVYRYTIYNGKKYSHIIDPRTGYGVTSQRNVTVIAKDGTTADWLATACSILPIKKALKLAKNENAELLIATLKNVRRTPYGEKIITYKTEKFESHFQKNEP
jgi:thiamine biosynthesis lipoprotein